MCGITGIINLNGMPAEHAVLQRMTDAIIHRGPDGEGHYINGPVGLGHRRLSIIDLSLAGHQPMATDDGRFVLTYNGVPSLKHKAINSIPAPIRKYCSRHTCTGVRIA
jgi:asparagine synthase (glutamine-hydrolysing)